jgi:four helix bundle protein
MTKVEELQQLLLEKANDKEIKYDLEDRTLLFAKKCIDVCKGLGAGTVNRQLIDQLVRASASVGANYREANETHTKKDFYYRIGVCRREAKEAKYWLDLLKHANQDTTQHLEDLIDEAAQLTKIFASIARTAEK